MAKFEPYRNEAGKKVVRTTTMLNELGWNKGMLLGWTRKQCMMGEDSNVIRDRAAATGTLAHDHVEAHIKEQLGLPHEGANIFDGHDIDQIEMAEMALENYMAWEAEAKPEYIASEMKCVSEVTQTGGTIDIVARVYDKLSIVDIKTSNSIHIEHAIQVAGSYAFTYEEVTGDPIEQCMILRLGKEDAGDIEAWVFDDETMDLSRETFLICRRLYDIRRILNKKNK